MAQQDLTFGIVSGKGPEQVVDVREFAHSMAISTDYMPMRSAPRLTHPMDTAVNWIDRIYNIPQYMRNFYDLYTECVENALNGNKNWLTDPKMGMKLLDGYGDTVYCVAVNEWKEAVPFAFPSDMTDQEEMGLYINSVFEEHIELILDSMYSFMPFLSVCLDYDLPEAFWVGNVFRWYPTYSYQCLFSRGKWTLNYTLQMILVLDSYDFRLNKAEYTTPQSVFDGIEEYNSLIKEIFRELPDTSVYHQTKYLNNWLTTHNGYSSALVIGKKIPAMAWSPISALRGSTGYDGPVCEGYARAFKILCDRLGIPATLAVGMASSYPNDKPEDHMWNEVKMDDGKWYGVDVTWNDPVIMDKIEVAQSGSETEEWFLLGKKSIVHDLAFEDSHPFSFDNYDEYANMWDIRIQSFLGDYSYDVYNSTPDIFIIDRGVIEVRSLIGSVIGRYDSMEKALENLTKGVYIIGRHKFVVR